MNMRTVAMVVGAGLAIGALWLLLGRRIVLLVVDWILPGSPSPKETGDLVINADSFSIGPQRWPFDLKVAMSRGDRVVLAAGSRAFTFGPVKTRWADSQYLFTPDAGDVVSFTRDVSRLEWHTPFAFGIMPGRMAKRHRYAYDRLRWKKNCGAALEIVWRRQQKFADGWQDQYDYQLTKVIVQRSPAETAAAAYLASKGWKSSEYRLESEAPAGDNDIVNAIYLEDEAGAQPGSGKSVQLRVNRSTGAVWESGWQ
jgi:hypothetical protein